jgi:hypothetical protein
VSSVGRFRLIMLSLFAQLLCSLTPAAGQRSCTSGTGVIQGIVRDDSTGMSIGGSWVVLIVPFCRVVADSAGRFHFDRLPAGRIQIDAGHAGYRRFTRLLATVAAGQTTEVEIRLRPGGPVPDCRVNISCAHLLREPMLPGGNEEEQFRLAAYVTTIAIAWKDVAREPGWFACVDDDSPRVMQELKKRFEHVAAAADCTLSTSVRDRISHAPTGSPAFHLRIGTAEQIGSGRKRAQLSYTIGGLWGEGWRCDFERISGTWRAALCVQEYEA